MFYENLLNKCLRLSFCSNIIWITLFSSVVVANPVRFTSSNSGEIAENETSTILVVEAVADELPADTIISITLVPGEDAELFSLVNLVMPSPSAGTPGQAELSFQSARNFEDPVDTGGTAGDNIYRVTVRATDNNGDFIDQLVSVTVNNVNETPTAIDDHYLDFPDLVIDEDSGELIINVTANDILGDAPTQVISAGATITNSFGVQESWRTTTRLVDRTNTGDSVIEANGEVSCANQAGCQDGETADTSIDASGILESQIMYKPRADFFGEDQFLYCIQDSVPTGEPVFSKEVSDSRCATVTIKVNPVNDLPLVSGGIIYAMNQADDLIVPVEEGLSIFVANVDYTHIDGQGCNPSAADCTPDENVEELFFFFQSVTTTNGSLIPPFKTDGSFNYRPDPTFTGSDSFKVDVCETPAPTAETCVFDQLVTIVVSAIAGAPEGLSDEVVEIDFDLADVPLELPVGPEANVLIVNDDSGSMNWDMLTNQSDGVYYFFTGNFILYTMAASDTGSSLLIAPGESAYTGEGFWRLRNALYNATYYNPDVRYDPWSGLNPNNVDFPNSTPTAALHNPMAPGGASTNLRVGQSYVGATVKTGCRNVCTSFSGPNCTGFTNFCGGTRFVTVITAGLYLPRYYRWNDRNGNGILDANPSPALNPGTSEGVLVEIRPASEGGGFPTAGSGLYPKATARTDCTTNATTCAYDEELQNFANWFTYARSREFIFKSALGKVVSASQNLRVGYAKINSATNRQPITSMNTSERTGAKANLLNAIYLTTSNGFTPLRSSLRDAGRHFECLANDSFDSAGSSNPGDPQCPIIAAPAGNCQQNFTLLLTDGAWNGETPYSGSSDQDDDNNTNFDGGVYAGSFNESLADVAMDYYERDLHSELANEVVTSARDRAGADSNAFESGSNELMHQHMKTFTVGFGVEGLVEDADVPTDYTQSFSWGNPTTTVSKIDDVRHAAVNGRGQYLSAGNSTSLVDSLLTAFKEFQQGSGAASAVSFNSNEILEDTLVFRSFYNTKNNTGDLVAQSIDENGVVDEVPAWKAATRLDALDPDERQIITIDRDPDSASFGSGIPFRATSVATANTGVGLNGTQRSSFISDSAASEAQQNLEVLQRVSYLRGDNSNERPTGNFRERPIEEGRLGDIVHSAPTFIGSPSRLGRDSVPFPQAEGTLYSDFKNANELRTSVVYVAANDGMIHGFNAQTGDEVIAYVPDNLMTNTYSNSITKLLNFEYAHEYFVDSTPAVNDVFMDVDGDGDKEWRTILVNGQGKGGKAYVSLDITDPTKFNEGTAGEVALWEFTDEDDTYPTDSTGAALLLTGAQRQDLLTPALPVKDLGYSFSVPTIVMSNLKDADGEHKWVSLFGNGYNSTSGIAKLFVLFLEGGLDGVWCHPDLKHTPVPDGMVPSECVGKQDFVKLDTGFGVKNGLPNGLGEPRAIDVDGNQTVDYVYAGDIQGNFFRFDITDSDHSNWTVQKIFQAQYKPGTPDEIDQPITTQPIAISHPTESGFIIIFGSGSYIRTSDSTNQDIQSIYGIWDRLSPELISKADLQEQKYTNVSDGLGLLRTLTNNPVDYSVVGGKKGWYIDLNSPAPGFPDGSPPEIPGERAVRNIQLRGGLGFVNSVFPQLEGSCVGRAGGAILSFCPDTGGSECFNNRTIFDLNNDGTFDDKLSVGEIPAGIILVNPAPPTDSAFIGDKLVTQTGQALNVVSTNTFSGANTGRLSWKRFQSPN